MTCLPGTGGPDLGLLLLGLGLLLLGVLLVVRSRMARAAGAGLLVLSLLTASALSPTDAQAAEPCPPGHSGSTGPGTGGGSTDPGDGTGNGEPATTRYDVTYSAALGGTLDGPTSQRVRRGGDAEPVTAVPDATHRFAGWSDGVTTARRHDTDVRSDITARATFALRTYTLTYAAGPGGTVGGTSPQTVEHGTDGTAVTAIPAAGFHFVRWSDGSTANPRTDTDVTADLSVSAQFTAVTYAVTYAAGPGGSVTGDLTQTVAHGADATPVTAVPDAGRHFVQWSDGSTANPRTDGAVVADISVTAQFAITTHRLQYAAGTGGSLTGDDDQTVDHGTDGTPVTAVPDTGYDFLRWSDGSTTNPRTDTNVTADLSIAAVFALHEYAVTYAAGPGGSVSGPVAQTVEHGTDADTVTAVPDTGYRFVRWSDGSTTNPRTDTNVTADLAVTAEFAVLEHTLTYAAGAHGSLGGTTPQTVQHGSDGTAVTAIPATGYHFVQWSDGSTTNPRTDTNVTADISVTAQFAITTYRLRYVAGAHGSIAGDDDQTVDHGTDGTAVTAVPDTGYFFVRWSDGSTANPRTDTSVVADLSVTAVFDDAVALPLHDSLRGELTGSAPGTLALRNPDTTEAEYLLVPTNDGAQQTKVQVAISGNAPLTGADPAGAVSAPDPHASDRRAAVALAQGLRGGVGAGTPISPAAQLPAGVVPAVGDALRLNGSLANTCATGVGVDATVRRVGPHVVIASDDLNPIGGFDAVQYDDLLDALETVVTAITGSLGATSDIDGNGRVVVLLTRQVNELSPPASAAADFALSRPRDLLSQVECPTSNVGEVFYAMAPDPTGVVNSNVRTQSVVLGTVPREVGHELGHQITDAARLAAGSPLDGTWLGEAIADIATDAVYYATSFGLTPLQNIVVGNITTGPNASRRVAAFNTYINQNFGRYRPWLQESTRNPVFAATPSTASRGAAWAFLNYAADRTSGGSLTAREAFLRSLVTGTQTGTPALAAALGTDPDSWLEAWAVAAYTDDQADAGALGTSGPFAALSWSFRSLFTALNGSYQLSVAALDTGGTMTSDYAARGGSRHIRFLVAAGQTATLSLTSLDVASPSVAYRVVRLR
ncbi:InlB B-repeat-containing protein [Nocardioides sp. LML1-1-1.1]|uniref:InlB B-repeat-containing protein n=1 Tax=Nocardioides sp. LML1-1-1.1 TaxID=3135248 RepID=UPI0034434E05